MKKQKLLFKAPVRTASGYGVHSRQILKSLMLSERFDISVQQLSWGNTSIIHGDKFIDSIEPLIVKYEQEVKDNGNRYDVSVQVTIPNEFKRSADVNIGITAGIEVDLVSPEWIDKSNKEVDVLIVPSTHSKQVFEQTTFRDAEQNTLSLNKTANLSPEGFDPSIFNTEVTDEESKFDTKFNFLFVGLGIGALDGGRKNITNLVKWFCEAFNGNEEVGLVLKTAVVNNSLIDFEKTKEFILSCKKNLGVGEFPRIHLVHGRMTDKEIASLYKDKNVKCFISLTRGEGFGLPLLEAAACGLPVMVTNWSGHLDFLNDSFIKLDFELKNVPQSAVWKGVIEDGTKWADVTELDVKSKMLKVVSDYGDYKEQAIVLSKHVTKFYTEEKVMSALTSEIIGMMERVKLQNPKNQEDTVELIKTGFVPGEDDGKKLLYTMPMSAGDIYISTAVVDSLKKKFPDYKIFFATKKEYMSITERNPNIHKTIEWQEWMMNIPLLEKIFDEVYTPNISVQQISSNWIHNGKGRKLGNEFASACLVPFGEYHIGLEEPKKLIEGDYIVFHPGSGVGQWEARNYQHWQEVIINIVKTTDLKIVQVGLKDDPLYEQCIDFRGVTENYQQLAYVIKNAKCLLGIDSVSMHLASGLDVDHVSLFGSSYPGSTGPVLPKNFTKLPILLETPTRYSCEKACYKYECSVDKSYPCINEISPRKVWLAVLQILELPVGNADGMIDPSSYKECNPTISGYTHVFNAKDGQYPFMQSIKSMLGFCDEVVVIDGGSVDGTLEMIEAIGDDRIKIYHNKWDFDEPSVDGQQKAFGRAMCTGDFLWQMDSDEIVHENDYDKVKKLVKRFPKQVDLLHLPIIELWGDTGTCRTGRHSWKWRLSRNNFRITHGIVKHARLTDKETGKLYAKKGMSDGCEYIDVMSGEYIPHMGFYNAEIDQLRQTNPQEYGKAMNSVFGQLPSVWHYSWSDIPRKIRNFKSVWNDLWASLYNEIPEDRFPDVSLDDEESVLLEASKMRKQGDEHRFAETFQLDLDQPEIMK